MPIVVVEKMKMAAILIAKVLINVSVIRRSRSQRAGSGVPPDATTGSPRRPPITAVPTNTMPTNSRPLPRKTVAKNRSSRSPILSRMTPMNHRNAMPANGTKPSAMDTACRFCGSVSQSLLADSLDGTDMRINRNTAPSSTEKTIPATPAERGVRRLARVADPIVSVVTISSTTANALAGGVTRIRAVGIPTAL